MYNFKSNPLLNYLTNDPYERGVLTQNVGLATHYASPPTTHQHCIYNVMLESSSMIIVTIHIWNVLHQWSKLHCKHKISTEGIDYLDENRPRKLC